ncbi:hypothetical protein GP486_006855 [Trichoglossum hirsutum]|uniref:F-box domain-containing protein n=1 Tax=Trichoglossum hirsutum TaxID=265104 RepID=A0A9P8L779_9PEZI|nr:hypothetical protein GP486_006855 [Trichoglossum hirsutum]
MSGNRPGPLTQGESSYRNARGSGAGTGGFDLFTALTGRPYLLIEIARHLSVNALVKLYSISRDFHTVVDTHMTTVVMSQAISKCNNAARTFSYTTYKSLCILDPSGRPKPDNADEVRLVPSFRWLRMVMFRETVVRRIVAQVSRLGHKLPPRATLVLKKIWFMMDISINDKRSRLIHNTRFWSNLDLYVATLIFVKLDMCFTDPTTGDGETYLRRLLMGQRSLTTLLYTLERKGIVDQLELIQLYLEYTSGSIENLPARGIFGVPKSAIGNTQLEGWGTGHIKLMRIDEIVMLESIKRRLGFELRYPQMLLWGHVDPVTLITCTPDSDPKPVGDETDSESDEPSPRPGPVKKSLINPSASYSSSTHTYASPIRMICLGSGGGGKAGAGREGI